MIDLKEHLKRYVLDSDSPDMLDYGREFLKYYDRSLWSMKERIRMGRMRNGRVLDIGSGFGWQAIMIALLGSNRCVSIDIRESMTDAVRDGLDRLRSNGLRVDVEPVTADICEFDAPPASFDAVHTCHCIEHIHDLGRAFEVIRRILKPGGRLIISNTANALNRGSVAWAQDLWRKRDRDWEFVESVKRERPIENARAEPFAVTRERIARRANPDLSDAEIATIVDATAGLRRPEIETIAREFATAGDFLPSPPPLCWCRDPETGEYCERMFDPYSLAEDLRRAGFRATVYHHFRRFPLNLLNGVRFRPLNKYLFNKNYHFIILCVNS